MEVIVTAEPHQPCRGEMTWPGGRACCALGRAGIVTDKREGDGGTPAGRWAVRRVLYRPDRRGAPVSGLAVEALEPQDGWCDDPGDAAYNRPVRLPYPASAETLWRDDHVYDVIVVLGHNDDPPVAGRGSAIFMHLANDGFGPTEGCVALARDDLDRLLAVLKPGDAIVIVADGRRQPE